MTIKEVAELLGVPALTRRRWDRSGAFPPHRYPVNGKRRYGPDAVLKLRKQIETGKVA